MSDNSVWTIDEVIGRNIRDAREDAGLTRDDMIAKLACWGTPWGKATLATIESGKRPLHLGEMHSICAVLKMSLSELASTAGFVVYQGVVSHASTYQSAFEGDLKGLAPINPRRY